MISTFSNPAQRGKFRCPLNCSSQKTQKKEGVKGEERRRGGRKGNRPQAPLVEEEKRRGRKEVILELSGKGGKEEGKGGKNSSALLRFGRLRPCVGGLRSRAPAGHRQNWTFAHLGKKKRGRTEESRQLEARKGGGQGRVSTRAPAQKRP